MPTDFYAALGVARTASKKELQQAFRRLARRYHPDVTGGDKAAEERFKVINQAYEVLADDAKRAAYDKWGDQWMHAEQLEKMEREGRFRHAGAGFDFREGGPSHDPFGVFNDLGGGGFGDVFDRLFRSGGRAGPSRGEDLEYPITVTLAEAAHGASRTVQLQSADGRAEPAGRRLEVKIPPGVETGSRIRLRGKGAPGAGGGPAGDLVLRVTVEEDRRFERKGADLIVDVRVPLTTAVLGGETEVATLDGRLALRIPEGTQNGRVFRLAGKGMPVLHQDRRGDLLARVRVVLPEALTAETRHLFETLRDLEPRSAPGSRSTDAPA